jgi:predicted TIM-barrel enzyme
MKSIKFYTIGKRFSREEVIRRLCETIKKGKPIIGSAAGAGIIAKCAELGGADLIILYATGRSRLMGFPTTLLGNANDIVIGLAEEILRSVKDTPIIAGVEATDPTRDMKIFLSQLSDLGFSGVINFPSVTRYSEVLFESYIEKGFSKELEVLRLAKEKDMFTMAYVYRVKDTRPLAEIVDALCVHCGWTVGGLVGADKEKAKSLNEAVRIINEVVEAAKEVNNNILTLVHGGPISEPEEAQYIYNNTCAVGFIGASAIERIPIEKAIIEVMKKFKSGSLKSISGRSE